MRRLVMVTLLFGACGGPDSPLNNPRLRTTNATIASEPTQALPMGDSNQLLADPTDTEVLIGTRVALAAEKIRLIDDPTPGTPPTPPGERDALVAEINAQLDAEIAVIRAGQMP